MERIRSFIAIDIDDPLIVQKIVNIQNSLSNLGVNIKFVEPQNIHLTLRFLGEISSYIIEEIKKILDEITFKSFIMKIEGIGAFPSIARPRVIWLGVTKGSVEVSRIHDEIEGKLRKLRLRPEKEKFTPHITIGRIRGGNYNRLRNRLWEMKDTVIGDFKVTCIRLKKSTLTSRGPIYTTLYERRAIE